MLISSKLLRRGTQRDRHTESWSHRQHFSY